MTLPLLGDIPARRSVHECNGALCCELFDESLLTGFTRNDPDDMSRTQELFGAEQVRNEGDGGSLLARTSAYVILPDPIVSSLSDIWCSSGFSKESKA